MSEIARFMIGAVAGALIFLGAAQIDAHIQQRHKLTAEYSCWLSIGDAPSFNQEFHEYEDCMNQHGYRI